MNYRTRIYYTDEQKAPMWDRWLAGDSTNEIAERWGWALRARACGYAAAPVEQGSHPEPSACD